MRTNDMLHGVIECLINNNTKMSISRINRIVHDLFCIVIIRLQPVRVQTTQFILLISSRFISLLLINPAMGLLPDT